MLQEHFSIGKSLWKASKIITHVLYRKHLESCGQSQAKAEEDFCFSRKNSGELKSFASHAVNGRDVGSLSPETTLSVYRMLPVMTTPTHVDSDLSVYKSFL